MIVDCISDLHGHYPHLEGGDLLVIAGDLTSNDSIPAWKTFYDWLLPLKYKRKLYIGGNHDNFLTKALSSSVADDLGLDRGDPSMEYLCDSGTEFEYFWSDENNIRCGKNFKIWGSPWTKSFKGQNPHCMAFTVDDEQELKEKFELIPEDTDILITHSPPNGILDQVTDRDLFCPSFQVPLRKKRVGSTALCHLLYKKKLKPKLHVFGHIHEGYGHIPKMLDMPGVQFVNASYLNEIYEPVNKPIRIIL